MLVGIQGAVRGDLHIVADVDAAQRRCEVTASLDVRIPAKGDLSALDQFENGVALNRGLSANGELSAIPMRVNRDIIIDEHALPKLDLRTVNVSPRRDVALAAEVNQLAPGFVGAGQLAGQLEEKSSQHRQGGKGQKQFDETSFHGER